MTEVEKYLQEWKNKNAGRKWRTWELMQSYHEHKMKEVFEEIEKSLPSDEEIFKENYPTNVLSVTKLRNKTQSVIDELKKKI